MRTTLLMPTLLYSAVAWRPFVEMPDTGIEEVLGGVPVGMLPNLDDMACLNDFQWAAQRYLPARNFTYYRNGAGGEVSYRNNLEVFGRYSLKAHVMRDVTGVHQTLGTTILGHHFSHPFFISPCARADYGHPQAEINLMRAASASGTLYIPSGFASKPLAEIAEARQDNHTFFRQIYFERDEAVNQKLLEESEAAGAAAIVWAIDSPGQPSRPRSRRYQVGSNVTEFMRLDWQVLDRLRNMTRLPILLKGIQSVEDARAAVDHGVPAIILSNHGGRNVDGARSSLEVALEIYNREPAIFSKTEVLADGGVRFGTDALRLLALGVRAVGLGRPFMFANVYGEPGVAKAIDVMRNELMNDAANLGLADLKQIEANYVDWTPNRWDG